MQDTPTTAITPATNGTALPDRERRGMQQSPTANVARPLPEYLTAAEVGVMLDCAPHEQAKLLMLIQWRSGVRISEALKLTWADVRFDDESPTILVRQGKGKRPRIVPLHSTLRDALSVVSSYKRKRLTDRIISCDRSTASRWVKVALERAVERGQLPAGRKVSTHTFRHSYARHLLMNGVPVNELSRWLGHVWLSSTFRYLELVPDPQGSLEQVP